MIPAEVFAEFDAALEAWRRIEKGSYARYLRAEVALIRACRALRRKE